MSKAFTREEAADEPAVVRPRAPLPEGSLNYVTERGLRLLRGELERLERERAELERSEDEGQRARLPPLVTRIAELAARIGSAVTVDSRAQPPDVIRFGATVTVRDGGGGQRRFRIVGVDEANGAEGRVAFVAPLARALLGRRVGESAAVTTPRGEEELEVSAVSYDVEP